MKIVWICGLPRQVQREALGDEDYGASIEWSWIMGHLPPPEGIELHIVCRTARHTQPKDFFYKGTNFHLVPVKARARVYTFFQFDWLSYREVITQLKPDVVHGWGTEDAYSMVAMKLAPDRHVVEVQGNLNAYLKRVPMTWQTRLAAVTERFTLARAHFVAAENEYSIGSAEFMIRSGSQHVIEHPLRPEFLAAPRSECDGKNIIFIGTIDERKGIWDALESFEKAAPVDWKMSIVGNGTPASVAKLRHWISQPLLKDRVTHYPQLTTAEIIALMQKSSVFLLPTRIDTGPTALKESLVMGLWPICYDNSGPGHYIRKFEYGNLAADLDRLSLTETLHKALRTEPWKQPIHQQKVGSAIRPHFEPKKIWQELDELYLKIIEGDSQVK